jgi:RND family efflux transporter MFP subunit
MTFQALALGSAIFATGSCSPSVSKGGDSSGSTGGGASVVAVTKPTRADMSKSIDLTAEFLPWQDVEIHARVSGYVKQMNVDVGDHAKAGDILATLEIPEIEDQLKEADAAVLTAQEQVKSTEAAYEQSSLLAGRLTAAAKETQGLIAQQDIDNATATNQGNAANLAAAKQKVVEAQAEADHIRDMVEFSRIVAPFDGVVTRRYADVGALVQAGTVQSGTSSGSNSMPLVSFAELKRLRLEIPVPEEVVPQIHVGDPVDVTVVSMNKTFRGSISRFAQKVDTSTRTMLTEVDVDNSDYAYTPGMYATVKLTLAQKKDALTIPIQSLNAGDKPTVLVVQDGRIVEKPVTVGLETPDKAEILDGLDEDDLVVVGSRSSLQAGEPATPRLVDNQNP